MSRKDDDDLDVIMTGFIFTVLVITGIIIFKLVGIM